jgi:hypothetical protein
MGLIHASVQLLNPSNPDVQGLVVLADGRKLSVPYMGPVEVRFANRRCFTGAMVLGDEVLLGAIPMEDMDLVLQPQLQRLSVNPANPNLPLSVAK